MSENEGKALDVDAIREHQRFVDCEGFTEDGQYNVRNAVYTLVLSDIPALLARVEKYELLRQAVNESTNECEPGCNSYGHTDTCPSGDAARWLADQQQEINQLRARLTELEQDARRLDWLEVEMGYSREAIDEAMRSSDTASPSSPHDAGLGR
jgi:hypothetical protein